MEADACQFTPSLDQILLLKSTLMPSRQAPELSQAWSAERGTRHARTERNAS